MNKKILILVVCLIIILISAFIIYQKSQNKTEDFLNQKQSTNLKSENMSDENNSVKMKATIVKVNDKSLLVVRSDNPDSLYSVLLNDEDISKFKANQEIIIYWNGDILTTWPGQITKVDKIEIINEESSVKIPDNILRHCYNLKENLSIVVDEFSLSKFVINIVDKNELPYEYQEGYKIYKEVPNENYTGVGQKIGEATANSTAGYTGTGTPYIWEEIEKVTDVSEEDAINKSITNSENGRNEIFEFDIEKLYGNLENGKYYIVLLGDNCSIRVSFEVKDNKVIYDEPQIEW